MDLASVLITSGRENQKTLTSIDRTMKAVLAQTTKQNQTVNAQQRRDAADKARAAADRRVQVDSNKSVTDRLDKIIGHVDELEGKVDQLEKDKNAKKNNGGILGGVTGLLQNPKIAAAAPVLAKGLAVVAGVTAGGLALKGLFDQLKGANGANSATQTPKSTVQTPEQAGIPNVTVEAPEPQVVVVQQPTQKLQSGGPVRVPGTGSGDKVPAMLPPGSFVLNRNASKFLMRQKGGAVPAMLEPGELVYPSTTPALKSLNTNVPRFQTGGEVTQNSHPNTGSGWQPAGATDYAGRPIIFSKEAAESFARMMKDGGVKASDVHSSQRSKSHNSRVGGVTNSAHLYGEAMDIHGNSKQWMISNSERYGWIRNNYMNDSWHWDYKGGGSGNTNAGATGQPAAVVLAAGTNDFSSPELAGNNVSSMVNALSDKNYVTTFVSPTDSGKFAEVSAATTQGAAGAGASTLMPTAWDVDGYHIAPAEAKNIKNKFPGAIIIGDSNAARIEGTGGTPGRTKVGAGTTEIKGFVDALAAGVANEKGEKKNPGGSATTQGGNAQAVSDPFGGFAGLLEFTGLLGTVSASLAGIGIPGLAQEIDAFMNPQAGAADTTSSTVGGPSSSPSSVMSSNQNISEVERKALDVIGKYESDPVGGYNAVNQYGGEGGRSTGSELGMYSGDIRQMSQHGGRALTDMTIGEIKSLQAKSNMSNDQWRDEGRLHAVGRYQFIGDTFLATANALGMSDDTKYSTDVQDKFALHLLKTSSNGLGQWVGPSDKASAEERAIVNQARGMKLQRGGQVGMVPTMLEPGETVGTMEQWNKAVPRFQQGGTAHMGNMITPTSQNFYEKTDNMDAPGGPMVIMTPAPQPMMRAQGASTDSAATAVPALSNGPSMAAISDYINRVSWSSVF